jgi:hypothetical protein
MSSAADFKHGDVVQGADWIGLVTTKRQHEDRHVCLSAWKQKGKWHTHPVAFSSGCVWLYTGDHDEVWQDFIRAQLLDEVDHREYS